MRTAPEGRGLIVRMLGRLLPWLLALAIIAPFCFSVEAETDLGWHLAIGRVIQQSGIPFRNSLCWTALNEPWYATSWLFDWIAAGLVSRLGILGVQLLMFVLVAVALTGALFSGLRINDRFGAWVTPMLALLLVPRMAARPFVASWAVLAWVFWLCLPPPDAPRTPESWDASFRRRLWALPLIAIGSNFHSGAVFPSILLGIFCFEAFLLSGKRWREVGLATVGVLALMANPGGFFNVAYVIQHLRVQSVVPLAEFRTPNFTTAHSFYVLSAIVILLSARLWRTQPSLVIAAVAFTGFGIWALRLMYDEEFIAAPLLALGAAPMARRVGPRIVGVVIALLLVLLVVDRAQWRLFINMKPDWDEHRQPVRAGNFIRANHMDGKPYNGFEEGGYLEWAAPELLWFQDGRVQAFPPEFFKAAQTVDNSPEDFRKWIRGLGVEWAVSTRLKRYLSGRNMFDAPDWALVYWDDTTTLYVRRDVERLAPLVKQFEYHHFLPTVSLLQKIAYATPTEVAEWKAELERFETTSPMFPSAWLARCGVAARAGESQEPCDRAAPLEDNEPWKKIVAAARTIPPLPPSAPK